MDISGHYKRDCSETSINIDKNNLKYFTSKDIKENTQ
jgi:hypothetical protein